MRSTSPSCAAAPNYCRAPTPNARPSPHSPRTLNATASASTLRENDGALLVPGESVTDPVAYTVALADAAVRAGATVKTNAAVEGIDQDADGLTLHLADGERLTCLVAVNCAGLHADTIARLVGDDSFEIYPRKGEFFVFELPAGATLDRILLPVPTPRTKGVLVFPTLDGKVVAGPTAVDQNDKNDWTVRPAAAREVLDKAVARFPALDGLHPVASYAGLRTAGRDVNYLIGPSAACPRLVNVAAIRSTGLTASLGIGAHIAELLPGARRPGWSRARPRPSPRPATGRHLVVAAHRPAPWPLPNPTGHSALACTARVGPHRACRRRYGHVGWWQRDVYRFSGFLRPTASSG